MSKVYSIDEAGSRRFGIEMGSCLGWWRHPSSATDLVQQACRMRWKSSWQWAEPFHRAGGLEA